MNDGTHRATVVIRGRQIQGLHICANCVTILMVAYGSGAGDAAGIPTTGPLPPGMVAVSETPWRGPCDLCRYTTALSQLLEGG